MNGERNTSERIGNFDVTVQNQLFYPEVTRVVELIPAKDKDMVTNNYLQSLAVQLLDDGRVKMIILNLLNSSVVEFDSLSILKRVIDLLEGRSSLVNKQDVHGEQVFDPADRY